MKMRPNVVNLSEVSLEAICSDIRESHVMAPLHTAAEPAVRAAVQN